MYAKKSVLAGSDNKGIIDSCVSCATSRYPVLTPCTVRLKAAQHVPNY